MFAQFENEAVGVELVSTLNGFNENNAGAIVWPK
jgi:hypothetical protein